MAGSCMGNGQLGPTIPGAANACKPVGLKGARKSHLVRATRLSGLTDGCSPSPREGLARLCWPGE